MPNNYFYERIPLRGSQRKAREFTVPDDVIPLLGGAPEYQQGGAVTTQEDHYRLSDHDLAALGGGDIEAGHAVLHGLFPFMLQEAGVVPHWAVTILGHGDAETGKQILDRFIEKARSKHRGEAA
jgi:hypothetical protein